MGLLGVSLSLETKIRLYMLTSPVDPLEEHGSVHQLQKFLTIARVPFGVAQAAQHLFRL
jgi:hypothetical protein